MNWRELHIHDRDIHNTISETPIVKVTEPSPPMANIGHDSSHHDKKLKTLIKENLLSTSFNKIPINFTVLYVYLVGRNFPSVYKFFNS